MPGATPGVGPPQPTADEASDADLVAAAQAAPGAFDALYRRHVARVYRFARARTNSVQDAEDVTTATFMEAFTSLPGYREEGHFGAWLFTIARRQVLAARRRSGAHEALDSGLPATADAYPVESEAVARALSRLSADRREVLLLRFYGELKIVEVARVLGKGESAVKMLLHRGLAQLRDILREDPRG